MPQVPYQPFPSVGPSEAGTPGLRVQPPGAAFGTDIAQAVSHLGQVAEHAGNEVFSRAIALQDVQNQSDARDAVTKLTLQTARLEAEFNASEGATAGPEALTAHIQRLSDLREQIRGQLKTPIAEKYYMQESQNWFQRNVFNAAGHSATQTKRYSAETIAAKMDADNDYVYQHPEDLGAYREVKAQHEHDIENTLAPIKGWAPGDPQIEEEKRKAGSRLFGQMLLGVARYDPWRARALYDAPENKDNLYGPDRLKLDAEIRAKTETIGAKGIADSITEKAGYNDPSKAPTMSANEMIAEGRRRAAEMDPKDPILPHKVEEAIRANYNYQDWVKRKEDATNIKTIDDAILEGVKDRQELEAKSPEIEAAIRHAPDKYRMGLDKRINDFNKQRDAKQNDYNYYKLLGMAADRPTDFLNLNIPAIEGLGTARTTELIKLQQHRRENAEKNPEVQGALRVLMPMYRDIIGKPGEESHDVYVGALQEAMAAEKQRNGGKSLNFEDIKNIGSALVSKVPLGPGWHWPWSEGDPRFQEFMRVPDVDASRLRKQLQEKEPNMPFPSDQRVQAEYFREQWDKLRKQGPKE